MSFVIAIIGRPNVGKSTLFNRIVGEQRALVHNKPGVTRDRLYASSSWRVDEHRLHFTLVDTGGLEQSKGESVQSYAARQADVAIKEADAIIAVVDGRAGLLPDDEELVRVLRKSGKPIFLCVNKIDINLKADMMDPFHKLGIKQIFPVSAQHNLGVEELMYSVLQLHHKIDLSDDDEETHDEDIIKLAIIGRPNVGKSRLLNYLAGEERSIVSDEPGTTLDPIDTHITYKEQNYLLIDTAGIRRQAKIDETLEYLAVLRSMRAVGRCDVAILVIDSTEGVTHQEQRLAEQILNRGRGLVCFYNKCDLLDNEAPEGFPHLPFVATCKGAAKLGKGMEPLMRLVAKVTKSYKRKTTTSKLNKIIEEITKKNPPPRPGGKQLKLRYITQTGIEPPQFTIFVNNLKRLSKNYEKYLRNSFYEQLKLTGVPIKIEFKESN